MKGAESFDDLKTFEGVTYKTYKETAINMGLIDNDSYLDKIFAEACNVMLPSQLKKFFAWFLISENFQGNIIWEKYKDFFTEDFKDKKTDRALLK